jgi:hypothetical protein
VRCLLLGFDTGTIRDTLLEIRSEDVRIELPGEEVMNEVWLEESTHAHTKIYSGSDRRSIIPYIHIFYIASVITCSIELDEAKRCVLLEEGFSCD